MRPRRKGRLARGFSVIELIAGLAVTGIIAMGLMLWMSRPLDALQQAHARAAAIDQAERVTTSLHRELPAALPNSLRVACGGRCLEFIPVVDYGDYRIEVPGDFLEFSVADDRFDVLTALDNAPVAGLQVVINNQNALSSGSQSAYSADSNNNRASIVAGATETHIRTSPKQFPAPSPAQRFFVVDGPVSYLCAPSASGGTLRRLGNYSIQSAQPTNTSLGDLLAGGVLACDFTLAQPDLLTLRLTVSGESAEPVRFVTQVRAGLAP